MIVFAIGAWSASWIISNWTNIWLGYGVLAALTIGGIVVVIAGIRDYRGEWPTIFGIISILEAIVGFSSEMDDYISGSSDDLALGLGFIVLFLIAGVLLLFSGHKLHRYSLGSKSVSRVQNNKKDDKAQPTDTDDSQARS